MNTQFICNLLERVSYVLKITHSSNYMWPFNMGTYFLSSASPAELTSGLEHMNMLFYCQLPPIGHVTLQSPNS